MPVPGHRQEDEVDVFVKDFAIGLQAADARHPAARGRTRSYQAGIGPFSETAAVELVMAELVALNPGKYASHRVGVPYPEGLRQRCDLCLGESPDWKWAIEVKLLRLFGDNGKLNDNMLMHILSPYPAHRSALTDCTKLVCSELGERKMVLIYAFDADGWPTESAIRAFERLAIGFATLGPRSEATFDDLVHPVHRSGRVCGWETRSTG